jgi:hypothetical protein
MIEISNFISDDDSRELIEFHNKNFGVDKKYCFTHRDTEVLELSTGFPVGFKKITDTLNGFIKTIDENYEINYFQIVRWPTGESQDEHKDFDYHPYTTILYLNDDYKGGETVVGDQTILPERNKLIGFEGDKTTHKVNEIIEGTRYTLPCWYKNA